MKIYSTAYLSCLILALAEGVLKDISIYKGFIATVHNFYRKYERAADMKELTWDPYLQKRAELWSENCFWDHQREGLGENLAYFWSSGAGLSTLEIIVKSCQNWWKEVNDWQWSTDCGQACHYTQMIWGSTERIGCSLSKCPSLRTDSGRTFNNADFFVCFYDPPGNFIGKHPYTLGQSCTRCDAGETCKDSLCSKSAGAVQTAPRAVHTAPRASVPQRRVNTQPSAPVSYTEEPPSEAEPREAAEGRSEASPKTDVRRVVYRWTY